MVALVEVGEEPDALELLVLVDDEEEEHALLERFFRFGSAAFCCEVLIVAEGVNDACQRQTVAFCCIYIPIRLEVLP